MSDGQLEDDINRYLWLIIAPILLVLGSAGNLMSIAVMSRSNMLTSQASVYLIALSLADLVVLYTGLLRYFIKEVGGVDVRSLSTASCQVHTTMVYVSLDTSVWILVAFTGERILSVFTPYKVKNICTRVTSLVTIAIIVVFMLFLNSHFMFGLTQVTHTLDDNTTYTDPCTYRNSGYEEFLVRIWPWVDFCVFNLVPFLLLGIGNTCIAVRVFISRKRAKKIGGPEANHAPTANNGVSPTTSSTRNATDLSPPCPKSTTAEPAEGPTLTQRLAFVCRQQSNRCIPSTCSTISLGVVRRVCSIGRTGQDTSKNTNRSSFKIADQGLPIRTSTKNDRTSSMTAILLLLNFMFLATTTPVSIFFIIQDDWAKKITTHEQFARFKLTFTVVNLIQYVNNSINFILYCITGSRFRKELRAMLFRRQRVFPMGDAAERKPRALEREITGLHTHMTVASCSEAEKQAQNPQFGNCLTVPGVQRAETQF